MIPVMFIVYATYTSSLQTCARTFLCWSLVGPSFNFILLSCTLGIMNVTKFAQGRGWGDIFSQ